GSADLPERFERGEIEHDDRAVAAGRGESVAARGGDRRAVSAVDARDFTEQLSGALVDDHDAILPADEDAMVRRIGDEIVPASGAANGVGVGDLIGAALGGSCLRGDDGDERQQAAHAELRLGWYRNPTR